MPSDPAKRREAYARKRATRPEELRATWRTAKQRQRDDERRDILDAALAAISRHEDVHLPALPATDYARLPTRLAAKTREARRAISEVEDVLERTVNARTSVATDFSLDAPPPSEKDSLRRQPGEARDPGPSKHGADPYIDQPWAKREKAKARLRLLGWSHPPADGVRRLTRDVARYLYHIPADDQVERSRRTSGAESLTRLLVAAPRPARLVALALLFSGGSSSDSLDGLARRSRLPHRFVRAGLEQLRDLGVLRDRVSAPDFAKGVFYLESP